MSYFAERSHKSKKTRNITPRIASLGRLCASKLRYQSAHQRIENDTIHVRPSFVRPGNLEKMTEQIILCHFLFHFTHTNASIFPVSCPFYVCSGHFVLSTSPSYDQIRKWLDGSS